MDKVINRYFKNTANMLNIKAFSLLSTFVFLIFIRSMKIWFLQNNISFLIIYSTTISLLYLFYFRGRITKENAYISLLLGITLFYCQQYTSIEVVLMVIFKIIVITGIITLSNTQKKNLLNFITKSFSLIIFISIFVWVLFLLGANLPHTLYETTTARTLTNYYFFLYDEQTTAFFPRFSSFFEEPGHLGTISSLILIANNFNLKKNNSWIICISLIISFSLAAYILTTIYLFIKYTILEKKIVYLLIITTAIFFLGSTIKENNILNTYILSRLIYEDGNISGNNRVSVNFEEYYHNIFLKSKNIFGGLGTINLEHMLNSPIGNGYKVFFVQYGIIGIFLVLISYCKLLKNRFSQYGILLLSIYLLSFIQRTYILWDCQIILFIITTAYYNAESQSNEYNRH